MLTTFQSREDALALARAAVEERVAACVQILGPIKSVYRWQGTVEETDEFLCLLKAPTALLQPLTRFIRERHPYDTPEITVVGSLFVDDEYLKWAVDETIGAVDWSDT